MNAVAELAKIGVSCTFFFFFFLLHFYSLRTQWSTFKISVYSADNLKSRKMLICSEIIAVFFFNEHMLEAYVRCTLQYKKVIVFGNLTRRYEGPKKN